MWRADSRRLPYAVLDLQPMACRECGVQFQPDRNDRKYCSMRCAAVANGRLTAARLAADRPRRHTRQCVVCGVQFTHAWRKTCSDACLHTARADTARRAHATLAEKWAGIDVEKLEAQRAAKLWADERSQVRAGLLTHQLQDQAITCMIAGMLWRQRGVRTTLKFIESMAEARA